MFVSRLHWKGAIKAENDAAKIGEKLILAALYDKYEPRFQQKIYYISIFIKLIKFII